MKSISLEAQDDPNSEIQTTSGTQPPVNIPEPVMFSEKPTSTTTGPHPAPGISTKRTQSCDKSGKATDIKQYWNNLKFSIIEG